MKTLLSLTLLVLHATHVFSQGVEEPEQTPEQPSRSGIFFLPILFYTPETRLAGGALLNFHYRGDNSEPGSRLSTIMPSLIYTQNKQILAELASDLYMDKERYRIEGYIGGAKFPNKFYGIGNETRTEDEESFTSRYFALWVNAQRHAISGLSLGLRYEFLQYSIIERDAGGLLASGAVAGSSDGRCSGAGIFARWDTRNDGFAPDAGRYYQASAVVFGQALGSEFSFTRYTLDLREYLPGFSSHVVALQGYVSLMGGTPPFSMLSQLGGQSSLRGYYEGRFRERNLALIQAEYRVHVWWRIGVVGFAGFGGVADTPGHLRPASFHHSLGAGLRYNITDEERIAVRVDYGIGQNSNGLYITIGEAF